MLAHESLVAAVPRALHTVELEGYGPKASGKVRDLYHVDGRRVLITTDRVSAFDRVLGVIPYKGQVLNQLSAWWFENTRDIVENHVLDVPDPNVTVAREAEALPVEVVVRGYITGVTSTALWTLYAQGERKPYGVALPDGLKKNDPLPEPIITPTTKAQDGGHDERITHEEIIERGLVSELLWGEVEAVAIHLFKRGQEVARRGGLILVDTKYEFGTIDGKLVLIDEVHTPDSSRYWVLETYGQEGQEPQNFDKEFLRLWFAERGYKGEGQPPAMPEDFAARVAARYIGAYERLTGKDFVPGEYPAAERIARCMSRYRKHFAEL